VRSDRDWRDESGLADAVGHAVHALSARSEQAIARDQNSVDADALAKLHAPSPCAGQASLSGSHESCRVLSVSMKACVGLHEHARACDVRCQEILAKLDTEFLILESLGCVDNFSFLEVSGSDLDRRVRPI
jgi:hypothetical protein